MGQLNYIKIEQGLIRHGSFGANRLFSGNSRRATFPVTSDGEGFSLSEFHSLLQGMLPQFCALGECPR